MSPRHYRMTKRNEIVAETRQKIVEATVALHGRKGIFGTSWQDIAREADVAVGTVYKHFPSLDELVPACGELLMQRIRPPSPDDAAGIIAEATEPRERLRRVAAALFAFYERGGDHLESDARERQLPAMREWEAYLRDMVSHFVRTAWSELSLGEGEVQAASVLLDFASFRAMRTRGIGLEEAVGRAVEMIAAWLERDGKGKDRTQEGTLGTPSPATPMEDAVKPNIVHDTATFARHRDQGEARWWLGSLAVIKATAGETGGLFSLVEITENEGEAPLHVHYNEDETFWVLEGDLVFEVGGQTIEAGPGSMLFGPRGVPHRYTVRRGPARMLFFFTPGGFEELLRATSEPAAEWRIPSPGEALPDFETLPAVVRRYGCELLE